MCSKKATSKYSQQPVKTSAGNNSSNSVVRNVDCFHGLATCLSQAIRG